MSEQSERTEIASTALLDAGDFLAQMAHEFKKAAKARHDCPNIAHCRGYVESEGDLVIAIAMWIEASNATHDGRRTRRTADGIVGNLDSGETL